MTMNQEALDTLLRVPMFAGLLPDEVVDLTRQASLRSYRKHTLLMQKGDDANVLYVVLSGRVKAFSTDDNGKEIVLNELGPETSSASLRLSMARRARHQSSRWRAAAASPYPRLHYFAV